MLNGNRKSSAGGRRNLKVLNQRGENMIGFGGGLFKVFGMV